MERCPGCSRRRRRQGTGILIPSPPAGRKAALQYEQPGNQLANSFVFPTPISKRHLKETNTFTTETFCVYACEVCGSFVRRCCSRLGGKNKNAPHGSHLIRQRRRDGERMAVASATRPACPKPSASAAADCRSRSRNPLALFSLTTSRYPPPPTIPPFQTALTGAIRGRGPRWKKGVRCIFKIVDFFFSHV